MSSWQMVTSGRFLQPRQKSRPGVHRPLPDMQPAPTDGLPYIEKSRSRAEKLIKYWWGRVFYDPSLRGLAGRCRLRPPSAKHGLVYRYIVNGRVRYIGQTIKPLYWRMTKEQDNGRIGYPLPIKRNLLNAYRAGVLRIETEVVGRSWLDKRERDLIRHFAPIEKLWNQEHNPHFDLSNYGS